METLILNSTSTLTQFVDLDKWLVSYFDLAQLLTYASLSHSCNSIAKQRNEYILFLKFKKYDEKHFEKRNKEVARVFNAMTTVSRFISINNNVFDYLCEDVNENDIYDSSKINKKCKQMCNEYQTQIAKNKLHWYSFTEKARIFETIIVKYDKKEYHERICIWAQTNNYECLFPLLGIKSNNYLSDWWNNNILLKKNKNLDLLNFAIHNDKMEFLCLLQEDRSMIEYSNQYGESILDAFLDFKTIN